MSFIKVKNNLDIGAPKTYLSSAVATAATTSPVRNTSGFTTQWAVQIGETGAELTEVAIGTAASGTSLTHPALSFDHPTDTPIYAIKFNQVVFEKSTSGTAGTATPMTDGTVTYSPNTFDEKETMSYTFFDDTAGASTDAYRTRFRNSSLAVQTSLSDWITTAGFSFYSLARIRDRIKDKMWDSRFIKEDSIIDNWVNEWKDLMTNSVISINEDYALGTVDVAFGTAGLGTVTTTDFKDVRRVWVTTDGVNFSQSAKMNINDFLPNQTFSAVRPYHAWLGDTVIQVKPDGSAGTARLAFYRFGTTLVNDTDELPQPMRSYTDSFVNYGLAQAFMKDNKINDYALKMAEANSSRGEFVSQVSARDKTGPTFLDLVEPLTGDDSIL